MKKMISFVIIFAMVFCTVPTSFGASSEANKAAQILYDYGLFSGTGTDANGKPIFSLDRAPSRAEAITMLVSLLGKKEEAMSKTWDIPFTDVADWAKPFVGYAYANGLTAGTGPTTFGSNDKATVSQYLTFVLKSLGYEAGPDFQWNKAWELSDRLGITSEEYNASTKQFLRGDVAKISASALNANMKGSSVTLIEKLHQDGAIKSDIPVKSDKITNGIPSGSPEAVKYTMNGNGLTVHSYTSQPLNNGYTRFVMDYTSVQGRGVYIFNSPDGDIVSIFEEKVPNNNKNTLTFDVSNENLKSIETLNVNFFETDDYRCIVTYNLKQLEKENTLCITNGVPIDTVKPVNYSMNGNGVTVHSYTSQPLNNDYTRFVMEYTSVQGREVHIFNSPNGDTVSFWGEKVPNNNKNTLTFDVSNENLKSIKSLNVNFFENDSNRCFVINNLKQSDGNWNLLRITNGVPIDTVKPVIYSTEGSGVKIHSFTYQTLNNGNTRYTVDYTAPAGKEIYVFGSGNSFMMKDPVKTDGTRKTVTFELTKEEGMASKHGNFSVQGDENRYKAMFYIANDVRVTNGAPVGSAETVKSILAGSKGTNHGVTAQKLDNGYIRITVEYTMPAGRRIRIYNAPNNDVIDMNEWRGTGSARDKIIFDVTASELSKIGTIVVNFYENNGSGTMIEFDAKNITIK